MVAEETVVSEENENNSVHLETIDIRYDQSNLYTAIIMIINFTYAHTCSASQDLSDWLDDDASTLT